MKAKILCFLLISVLTGLPVTASADGFVISVPIVGGDWTWVGEDSQQAFINYQDGLEKLIVAVDIEEHSSDAVWIMPIPGKPEDVKIDITSDLPMLFGDEVISKAKIALSESIKVSCAIGAIGQIWTIPPVAIIIPLFMRFSMRAGGVTGAMISGDLVSVETHIEKKGMVAEVITAKTAQALYDYLSSKGLKIEQGSVPVLDSYLKKDYVFVASWISSGLDNREDGGKRGIFITFPTSEIYYPLLPTSVYGEKEIPITIRVLGHVKPRIYPEIEPHTITRYLTKTERKRALGKPSSELQEFYGGKQAWKGDADYTRIRINAPVELLKEDLWMKARGPLRISLALPAAKNPVAFGVFLYFFTAAILSLLAGGIAGLICFRRFKKYALIGLTNIGTIIGLLIALRFAKEEQQQSERSKHRFVFFFLTCSIPLFAILLGFSILLEMDILYAFFSFIYSLVLASVAGSILALILRSPFLRSPFSKFILLFSILFVFLIFSFWVSSRGLIGVRYVKGGGSEENHNLAAIRTAQESYFAENGVYVECKPSPPDGGTDAMTDPWANAGGFDEIGFMPYGRVRYQYAVTVSDDRRSFIITAAGDLDEDGVQAIFTVDKKADTYPKAVRSGDDY